ncbi:MAG TPA: NADH-quinone oxidoreductase subunit NuoH [Puia sp.]|jgi:NADH-quinone oxidoreductase subunit H|nr:NADH-quinone oxidoreductase subunit NuoH [Puia sp.]
MYTTLLAIDWVLFLDKVILITVILLLSLLIAMYETWAERKVAALMQDRRGPNRAGPGGILQPLADGLKLFMKEEVIPGSSNKLLFILGPGLAMLTAMMTSAVVPWSSYLEIGGRHVDLQIADVNIGLLYIFGVVSMGVYGVMIGGWASNNKFSLLAAIRGASQIISYELAMGLSIISLLMITGSLSLRTIVQQQQEGSYYIFLQPLGFLIFLVCAFAECNRTPFDLSEADSELNMGFHLEYSSMKLGFYLFAEYVNVFISSAVMSTLYFGGYDIPFVNDVQLAQRWGQNPVAILEAACFFVKIVLFILFFIWVRWTIPRFRYDQLMKLGWKVLIPLAIINMLLTGFFILLRHH